MDAATVRARSPPPLTRPTANRASELADAQTRWETTLAGEPAWVWPVTQIVATEHDAGCRCLGDESPQGMAFVVAARSQLDDKATVDGLQSGARGKCVQRRPQGRKGLFGVRRVTGMHGNGVLLVYDVGTRAGVGQLGQLWAYKI